MISDAWFMAIVGVGLGVIFASVLLYGEGQNSVCSNLRPFVVVLSDAPLRQAYEVYCTPLKEK